MPLFAEIVRSDYAAFVSTLIKDIRSERPKITEKDHLRLLYVSKWFLEFFLALHSKQATESEGKEMQSKWNFELVAEVTEREWIGWVFKRMREAVEEKACFPVLVDVQHILIYFVSAKIVGRATDGHRLSYAIAPTSRRHGVLDIITSRSQRRRR